MLNLVYSVNLFFNLVNNGATVTYLVIFFLFFNFLANKQRRRINNLVTTKFDSIML